ncbi:putative short chain dehydrogenase family protein [Eutypa lata UCREL1]|uniref:Putative short chain dehydrogenase family protein n=1 Tax=Eutypa lata (strain UCR-EL1) TaxID=1287681 RepID=M7T612_EUTLA|nr:putative short chain dehydrogenase family protein [Eutypa lata UCREL1]
MAEVKPLKDKVILITGAGQGIGAALAKYVADRGAIVSLSDISGDTVKAVEQSIRDEDPEFQGLSQIVDVCDPGSVKRWVEETKNEFGRIDGCVNSAGILQKEIVPLTEIKLEDWQRVLDVNLTGLFNCLQHQMAAIADGGSIVNIASVAGMSGVAGIGAYAASKHGVVGLTKVAAGEGAARRVRVNVVCPNVVDTPMAKQLAERSGGQLKGKTLSLLKGLVQPEEIAALISFLLCDETRFITKAVYPIDGGFSG